MLDDGAGRGAARIELGDAFIGRVGVVDVVVGELLALHLPRGGDAEALAGRAIERRALVRVLAIAQRLDQLAAEGAVVGRAVVQRVGEPVGDRRVIGGGARIGLGGELLAQRERGHAGVLGELGEHGGVVGGLDHDRDVGVVLGGGADHRRAADVDVLDAVVESRALRDGRLERIEIDHQQIDRPDAVRVHRGGVLRVVADRQQAAMHLRVQRLDPAVHHLRESR